MTENQNNLTPEEITKLGEKIWEEIQPEYPDGVNPYAFMIGFKKGFTAGVEAWKRESNDTFQKILDLIDELPEDYDSGQTLIDIGNISRSFIYKK